MQFNTWKSADSIVIRRSSKTTLKTITDRQLISTIVGFADARTNDWKIPFGGTPVPDITLDFYSSGRFLGHLGVGGSFLEAQGCGAFVSRSLVRDDAREITRLIGLTEDLAK
jgi:hypothetical protein